MNYSGSINDHSSDKSNLLDYVPRTRFINQHEGNISLPKPTATNMSRKNILAILSQDPTDVNSKIQAGVENTTNMLHGLRWLMLFCSSFALCCERFVVLLFVAAGSTPCGVGAVGDRFYGVFFGSVIWHSSKLVLAAVSLTLGGSGVVLGVGWIGGKLATRSSQVRRRSPHRQ
uniref:Uncharacterized protein n=1 Tax=Physcomitrium patens TaxID=3218 RepID=A0A2K1J3L7_PHYPA|nr:hypothetical protein PHYPA_021975 [Physcomitrium patens]